jgi:hypothetical protein
LTFLENFSEDGLQYLATWNHIEYGPYNLYGPKAVVKNTAVLHEVKRV